MIPQQPRPAALAVIAVFACGLAHAGDGGGASPHWKVEERGGKIISHIWVPPGYNPSKPHCLAISLHGAGGRGPANGEAPMQQWQQIGPDVTLWLSSEVQSKHPTIVFMPQCPEPRFTNPNYDDKTASPADRAKYQWVASWWGARDNSYDLATTPVSTPMAEVTVVIGEILKNYNIDRTRIYVLGGSMGGFGTWDIVMRNPNLFAAAVPMAGGADPKQAKTVVAGGTRIWTIHGREDGIVPETSTVAMVKAMQAAGAKEDQVKLTLLGTPGQDDSPGHIWEGAEGYCKGVTDWMFAQKRATPGVIGTQAPDAKK